MRRDWSSSAGETYRDDGSLTTGTRPYSFWKITLTVLSVLAVVGLFVYFQQHAR